MLCDEHLTRVNSGPWVTAYTLFRLRELPDNTEFILPICSLGTPLSECSKLGTGTDVAPGTTIRLVLPPLYHEALTETLQQQIIKRIIECFPKYGQDNSHRIHVVELDRHELPKRPAPDLLAFSVDTAVEEHGPHLPLATDTIQSDFVLQQLQSEFPQIEITNPLDYGQLTWGLPFGFSIDITADLLTEYVCGYCNALDAWLKPRSVYVVDVHGSMTHRKAIVQGIAASRVDRWLFRWLHEPLAEFASARGDQHAGGVETVLVERANPKLVDLAWWPDLIIKIADHQMSFEKAVELTPDLDRFCQYVQEHELNGVIGDIYNACRLDVKFLVEKMLSLARYDVQRLLGSEHIAESNAGHQPW